MTTRLGATAALLLLAIVSSHVTAFIPKSTTKQVGTYRALFSVSPDASAEAAFARTQAHLKKLQQRQQRTKTITPPNLAAEEEDLHPQQQQSIRQETLYQQYILQSANSLKQELDKRKLNTKGRKPDLARRLAQHDLKTNNNNDGVTTAEEAVTVQQSSLVEDGDDDAGDYDDVPYPVNFAGIPLSLHAATALHQAGFLQEPSPIQAAALPAMAKGQSVLLHAPTGSGKTIAYTLPITEFLWRIQQQQTSAAAADDLMDQVAVICTPTRELAAQVAGVVSTLAPQGSVRLLSHPSNLMTDGNKDLKNRDTNNNKQRPSIIVGSAKAIVHSLYGNDDYPAPPTPKPLALQFMKNIRVLVLDEVDRLLAVQGKHREHTSNKKKHEKPAAILAAAVARHTLGKAQIVAASATVGRPLKRELARVLGLPPPEGPRVIVAQTTIPEHDAEEAAIGAKRSKKKDSSSSLPQGSSRLVTIPKNVKHYLAPVAPDEDNAVSSASTTSPGQLLIKAYQVIQDVMKENDEARILLVLTRGFGISTQHVIGALQHFNCEPPPQSLLDALQENALEGTDHMMQVHRKVSGATGVGQSSNNSNNNQEANVEEDTQQQGQSMSSSSLWVTGEDTIRGLHLDGLDVVLVVGRPRGPDEYTHIAGRTGRAGRSGKVVAVISQEQAPMLRGWETMLKMNWQTYGENK